MAHAITVEISDDFYDQLQRTAELIQRPLDLIVKEGLVHTVSPLVEDIPAPYQRDLYPLLTMDEIALMGEAKSIFPMDRWEQYEALLEQKKERSLRRDEETDLDELRREADIFMLRKGYAALLLKRRGYHSPTIDELPKVS